MPDRSWSPLSGGSTATVELRGSVVRRSAGPWTPAVHALLRHLEARGFDRAPRVLGVDPEGREHLSYLPGEVPSAVGWSGQDECLAEAALLLRRFHDATVGFPAETVTGWDPFFRRGTESEVICHNDFGVHNCVFVGGRPWGMIDFDSAAPGSRVWDLGWTAVAFVPLDPHVPAIDHPRRLRLICDAYGLAGRAQRLTLLDAIEVRLQLLRQGLRAVAGTDAPQARIPPTHRVFALQSLRLVRRLRPRLLDALA